MRLAAFLTIALVVAAMMPAEAGPSPRPAPVFELQLFSGQTFRLADHLGKSAVLVWFWAPW